MLVGRPPGPGMCPPAPRRALPSLLLARAWPHTRVPPALPRTLPALGWGGGAGAPRHGCAPPGLHQRRATASAALLPHAWRPCPTHSIPARCSCRCHHLAGTRGTAVRGQPGGCCHTAGVRVGGRDAGSMRDCSGGAVDRDAPELGCPRQCPPGQDPAGQGAAGWTLGARSLRGPVRGVGGREYGGCPGLAAAGRCHGRREVAAADKGPGWGRGAARGWT